MHACKKTPSTRGHHITPTLNLSTSHTEVNILNLDHLGAEHNLVTNVQDNEEQDTDVIDKKVARVPLDEDGESTGQDDQNVEEQTEPGQIRLEWSNIG